MFGVSERVEVSEITQSIRRGYFIAFFGEDDEVYIILRDYDGMKVYVLDQSRGNGREKEIYDELKEIKINRLPSEIEDNSLMPLDRFENLKQKRLEQQTKESLEALLRGFDFQYF